MKASECKCCICGKQAVAFWPVIDPDIPSNPYCRKCLNKEKIKALVEIMDWTGNEAKQFVKQYYKTNDTDRANKG